MTAGAMSGSRTLQVCHFLHDQLSKCMIPSVNRKHPRRCVISIYLFGPNYLLERIVHFDDFSSASVLITSGYVDLKILPSSSHEFHFSFLFSHFPTPINRSQQHNQSLYTSISMRKKCISCVVLMSYEPRRAVEESDLLGSRGRVWLTNAGHG